MMEITVTVEKVESGIFKGQYKVSDGTSTGISDTFDDAYDAYEDCKPVSEALGFYRTRGNQ